ncbi:F-box protein [Ceratobasidium sp. AG-Ba]|nr:F-box protein [Ceratobasidium sp. AG-Ba]
MFTPLNKYPFPTAPTIINWECFEDLLDASPLSVKNTIQGNPGHLVDHLNRWRESGEEQLVRWWRIDAGVSGIESVVKIHESIRSTCLISPDARFLLRADTIFSEVPSGTPGGQGDPLYYPSFTPDLIDCPCHSAPRVVNAKRMYRHVEAETVVKSLLVNMGIPNIAYLELRVAGSAFMCEQCDDLKIRMWDEMVDHYRHESKSWSGVLIRRPEFEVKHPIKFFNPHNVLRNLRQNLLVRRMEEFPVDLDPRMFCVLCRNYRRSRVFSGEEHVLGHIESMHGVKNGIQGLHYASYSKLVRFDSWGKKWKRRWDKHHNIVGEVP